MTRFGEILMQLRQEKHLSQAELGRIIYVSGGTISNYENGVHYPDVEKLFKLADYFEVSMKHAYCKRLKAVLNHPIQTIEFESSMNQISNLLMLPSCQDSSVFSLDIASILSERECQIIVLIYKYQLSSAEIARKLHTTRQNVNQCKKRAEQKLRTYYEK